MYEFVEAVRSRWSNVRAEIIECSSVLWATPEVGMTEQRSSAYIADWLARHGFSVERGAGGLPTAFRATYERGAGPAIALLAEYDALPGLGNDAVPRRQPAGWAAGQGCGHNLIAAVNAGAAIAARHAMDDLDVHGRLAVLGCPAEEILWGKIAMLEHGVFDGYDALLTSHASYHTSATSRPTQALFSGEFVFLGAAGHGSDAGARNALDAAEHAVQSVDRLRAHQFPDCSVEHVLRVAGLMPNISPDEARLWVYVRNVDYARARSVYELVARICRGAAELNGTRCREQFITATRGYLPNHVLARRLFRHLERVGSPQWADAHLAWMRELVENVEAGAGFSLERGVCLIEEGFDPPSQDDGEASWHIPLGRLTWAVPQQIPFHHWAKTSLSGHEAGQQAPMVASEALALAAIDLLSHPEILNQARAELEERRNGDPSPPLLGAFETLTRSPERFWDGTWDEPLTLEEAARRGQR
ncbi:MAG: amidohydrolase [Gammaproteobacteria bacterium]